MKIECAYDELVPLHKLVPNPKNPNKHPQKQIDRLAKLLDFQGQRHPIIVSKQSGFIVVGHGRLEAIKALGWEEAAVNFQDFESEAQEYAFVVSDNAIAEWADLDLGAVNLEMLDMGPDFNIDLLGIEDFRVELADKLAAGDPNAVPAPPDDPRIVLGDIFEMGQHKMMCGDATKIDDVTLLMGHDQADLVVTDPPYNVDYEGGTGLKIQNDSFADGEAFLQFLTDAMVSYFAVTKPGAAIYVFHADSEGLNFRKSYEAAGFMMKQCCVWVKSSLVMGRQDYQWMHEPILYGWKPGASHNWYSDRKQTTVWEFNKPSRNGEHPTMKPIDLISYPIENSSKQGDIVVDFFGGSGSTLIACEKIHRKCRTLELDPKYCAVILNRWQAYSGQKAMRSDGVLWDDIKSGGE